MRFTQPVRNRATCMQLHQNMQTDIRPDGVSLPTVSICYPHESFAAAEFVRYEHVGHAACSGQLRNVTSVNNDCLPHFLITTPLAQLSQVGTSEFV